MEVMWLERTRNDDGFEFPVQVWKDIEEAKKSSKINKGEWKVLCEDVLYISEVTYDSGRKFVSTFTPIPVV